MKKYIFLLIIFFLPMMVYASDDEFVDVNGENIWIAWTHFESDSPCYQGVTGYGCADVTDHGFGKYQFDRDDPDLVIFMKKMVTVDSSLYSGFQEYIDHEHQNGRNDPNTYYRSHETDLAELWIQYESKDPDRFNSYQDQVAYEEYYAPMKDALLKAGVDITKFGPVIRGTVWSIAIRDGKYLTSSSCSNNQCWTYHALVDTYHDGISDEEYLRAIMAAQTSKHTGDGDRWSSSQLQSALNAMQVEDNTDITNTKKFNESGKSGGSLGGLLEDPYPYFAITVATYDTSCKNIFMKNATEYNDLGEFMNQLYAIIKITAVALFIILSTFDIIRTISDPSANNKEMIPRLIKRFGITMGLFFLPDILQIIFQLFGLYNISNCDIG